jgi:hypothetical protein
MTPVPNREPGRKPPPAWVLNTLTALVGILTLSAGIGWIVYEQVVNRDIPYFAIPLVLCVPVIAAVAFRNLWD